jgi:hypothetical protein
MKLTGPETITIRLATNNDIEKMADLHCSSFGPEDHVPVLLGRNYIKAMYRWKVNGKEAYTLVAESHGLIVGLVAVCDRSFTLPMFKACFPEFIKSIIKKPSILFDRSLWRRFFRRSDNSNNRGEHSENQSGIAQMIIGVVDSAFRGRGVFAELIESTKAVSKSRGSKAIRAGIYKNNSSSRRVFIKSGWIELPAPEASDTVFYVANLAG